MERRAWMRQLESGRWEAGWADDPDPIAMGPSKERCLGALRTELGGEPATLVVEVTPRLAGVAEAAGVMEWDKRRVITYINRGSFPRPIQSLASGRVWRREDIERFAQGWRARRDHRRGSSS